MANSPTISNPELPLISAVGILPAGQSPHDLITCFQAQTYPNRELILVHNSTDLEAARLVLDLPAQVKIIDTGTHLSAGMCRNYGISAAQGNVLIQFDPNCWHHPDRLASQIEVISKHDAHVCLLTSILEYSSVSGYIGYMTNPKNYITGSMMFLRPQCSYPDSDKLEELGLLTQMVKAGHRPVAVERPHLMIRLHPGGNITIRTPIPGSSLSLEHLELVQAIVNTPS